MTHSAKGENEPTAMKRHRENSRVCCHVKEVRLKPTYLRLPLCDIPEEGWGGQALVRGDRKGGGESVEHAGFQGSDSGLHGAVVVDGGHYASDIMQRDVEAPKPYHSKDGP